MHTKIIASSKPNTPDIVLFYQASSPFSNFHRAQFSTNYGTNFTKMIRYSCSEQYFMHQKALFAGDIQAAQEVLDKTNPAQMKKVGRGLKMDKNMLKNWDVKSSEVMHRACYEKFAQNPELRLFLFRTHGMKLAEAAPNDYIWGIGLDIHDEMAEDPDSWHGENRLGKVLEQVRTQMWDMELYREDRRIVEGEDQKKRIWTLRQFAG